MNNSEPLLTIAIPTFNRSKKLDAQIKWAVDSIGEYWHLCQLLVSDNASTDETSAVCKKWKEKLGDRLTLFRQALNLSQIENICFCITYAASKYVWTVSDDDPIQVDAVATILKILQKYNNLGFLHINHRCISGLDGSVVYERFYPWLDDQYASLGRSLFEQCLEYRETGLLYITTCIRDKKLAIQAIESWQKGIENLAFIFYIDAYVASQSSMYVTSDILLDIVLYVSSWQSRYLCIFYYAIPEIYLRLIEIGYDKKLMLHLILAPIKTRIEAQKKAFVFLYTKKVLTFLIKFPLCFVKSLQLYAKAIQLKRYEHQS